MGPDSEPNRLKPEQWASSLVGSVVGIAGHLATGSLAIVAVIAGMASLATYWGVRAWRWRRERAS